MITEAITVQFEGINVGVLAQQANEAYATFQYFPEWVADGFSIDPIHMPLSNTLYNFPALDLETFKGLPAVFADSLPDDFGNAVINSWLAKQGESAKDLGSLDRLLYIGTRGMGALEYQDALDTSSSSPDDIDISMLVGLAQDVLNERYQVNVSVKEDDGMYQLFQIGTSAGGARAKAVIAMNTAKTVNATLKAQLFAEY